MNHTESLQLSPLLKLIEHLDEAITVSDEAGHFAIFNARMEALTGYSAEEVNKIGDFTLFIYPDPQMRAMALEALNDIQEDLVFHDTKSAIRTKDGSPKTLSVSTMVFYDNRKMFLSIYRDISDRKETGDDLLPYQRLSDERDHLLKTLKELIIKDAHMNLYNYRYLMERLSVELKRAQRHIFPLSVLMLDLDYLKVINDVYGHQYANGILKEFSVFLKDFTRAIDIVARYGGDEFVIVLPNTNGSEASLLAKRLLEGISHHVFDDSGKKIRLKISMGLSSFPDDGRLALSASGLIHLADQALLNAKKMGRNRLCIFKEMNEEPDGVLKNARINADELKERLYLMAERTDNAFIETIRVFVKTIKPGGDYPDEHIDHMVSIVVKIAEAMGLPLEFIRTLRYSALLYDLGKAVVPDELLQKRMKLTAQEYEIIKKHSLVGAQLLKSIYFLDKAAVHVLYHHERFDGLGYPSGLRGKGIPLGSRIIAIADVYEALISQRPYRPAYSRKEATEMIRARAGTQFDPAIVDVFLRVASAEE